MSTFRKDDIGYESGGWPATDLPSLANPAAKLPTRRKGRRMAVRLGILASLAISYLLYYYADVILQVGPLHSIVAFITSLFKR
jgi:hypothetical protein